MSRPIEAAYLLFFDLETSGLRPDRGARISEGALINHRSVIIDWANDEPFNDELLTVRLPVLFRHLVEGVVVGHNLSFDFGFLSYEAERLSLSLPEITYIDTLALAHRLPDPAMTSQLADLVRHFGCNFNAQLHTAIGDVKATRMVFWELCDELDLETLADAGAKTIRWNSYS